MTDIEKSIQEEAILVATTKMMQKYMQDIEGMTCLHEIAQLYIDLGNNMEELAIKIDELEKEEIC